MPYSWGGSLYIFYPFFFSLIMYSCDGVIIIIMGIKCELLPPINGNFGFKNKISTRRNWENKKEKKNLFFMKNI